MNADRIRDRLHQAIHRAPRDVSQKEFEEVTAVVLAIVVELGAETALVIGELRRSYRSSRVRAEGLRRSQSLASPRS